jgi:hypothetical protein
MNRQASAVFLDRGFAWQPSVQNQLTLSLPWWQHLQSALVAGKGVTENDILQTRQIKHLYIELRNESQVALLAGRNGGCDSRQGSNQCLVVCSKLEQTTFTKIAKVADGQMSC